MSEKILSDILEQLNNMSTVQQEMKNNVTDLNNDIAEVKNDITDLNNDIAEIKKQTEDIPAIKVAALETNEIVERIESAQESHEHTLDLLSRRSIDQEAELKRIK